MYNGIKAISFYNGTDTLVITELYPFEPVLEPVKYFDGATGLRTPVSWKSEVSFETTDLDGAETLRRWMDAGNTVTAFILGHSKCGQLVDSHSVTVELISGSPLDKLTMRIILALKSSSRPSVHHNVNLLLRHGWDKTTASIPANWTNTGDVNNFSAGVGTFGNTLGTTTDLRNDPVFTYGTEQGVTGTFKVGAIDSGTLTVQMLYLDINGSLHSAGSTNSLTANTTTSVTWPFVAGTMGYKLKILHVTAGGGSTGDTFVLDVPTLRVDSVDEIISY